MSSPVRVARALLVLLLPVIATSAPSVILPPDHDARYNLDCVPIASVFPKEHICRKLFPTVASVIVPNPTTIGKSLNKTELIKAALGGFEDFNYVFQKDNFCSDKIYTLLCFFYFPICTQKGSAPVLPCEGVCEKVTDESSECTRILLEKQNAYGGPEFDEEDELGWPIHFENCNYTYQSGTNTISPVYQTNLCVEQTHQLTLSPSTLKVTKELGACAALDCLASNCNCNPRRGISGQTFIKNAYNYSIECQVNSITTHCGREAINCTVTGAYSIECAEAAATVNSNILVLGEDKSESCSKSCFDNVAVGRKYLIAGYYLKRDDNLWFATKMNSKRAMIVESNDSNKKTMAKAVKKSCSKNKKQ